MKPELRRLLLWLSVLCGAVAAEAGEDASTAPLLQVLPAEPAVVRQYFPVYDFGALAAGAESKPWGGTLGKADVDGTQRTVLRKEFTADGGDRGLSHGDTVMLHQGQSYTLRIRYRTAMKGVTAQVHFYGFGTWGDTVANRITPLPPTDGKFVERMIEFSPAPGAICMGFWCAVPKGEQGALELAACALEGAPWGGAAYPPLADAPAAWSIWEDVYNSVPINSQYFGKNAQRFFRVQQAQGQGGVWLPAGLVIPPQPGTYTVGLEVRELGEGPLIAAGSAVVRHPAAAMCGERLQLPALTRSATVRLWCWDERGALRGERLVTVQRRATAPFRTPLLWTRPLATPAHPGAGSLSIRAGGETIRDWRANTPLRLMVVVPLEKTAPAGVPAAARAVAADMPADGLKVRVENFDRSFVREFLFPSAEMAGSAPVEFVPPAPDVYYVTAELHKEGVLRDRVALALGFRDVSPAPAFVAPAVPAVVRSEDMNFPSVRYAPQARENFQAFLADLKQYGSNTAGMGYDLASFNPLPGVYRFQDLDAQVRAASAAGIKSEVFLYLHNAAWPVWAGREEALDDQGQDDDVLSPASDGVRAVVGAAYGALARHYRGTPDLIGYNFWNTWFDWTYRDNRERVFDYCPSALEKWHALSGGLPAPRRPGSTEEYLRPAWRKWADLRDAIIRLWVVDMLGGSIRAHDPERVICPYLMAGGHGRMERLWPDFARLKMQPAHGGSESRTFMTHGALVRQYGIAYRHEDVAAPARHPLERDLLVYHSLFNGVNAGGKAMYNTQWNLGWTFTHNQPGVVNARRRGRALYDRIEEMQAQGFALPPARWALYDSWDNSALGGAHFQWYGLGADLELGRLFESFSPDDVSDVSPLKLWEKYRLVFANGGRVFSPETADKVLAYVEGGGVFALALQPGAAQQALQEKLAVAPAQGAALPERLGARGKAPLFSPGRTIFLHKPVRYALPPEAKELAAAEDGAVPLAWELSYGEGRFLLFSGAIDVGASAGFLEDLLEPIGITPVVRVAAQKKGDAYPPEVLEFRNPAGERMLWVHRAVRWDRHGELIGTAQKKGAAPDFDGLAEVSPREAVTLTVYPEAPGDFQVARWENGAWSVPERVSGAELSGPALTLRLVPGEIGLVRVTPLPLRKTMSTANKDDAQKREAGPGAP